MKLAAKAARAALDTTDAVGLRQDRLKHLTLTTAKLFSTIPSFLAIVPLFC